MPRRAAYHVQWLEETHRYEIQLDQAPAPSLPMPDSQAWFDWLEGVGSFAFSSQARTHCTVLKERVQRGDTYWYGYRSLHGRTVKRYLGRTKDLSIARLEEVAALLADESSLRQRVPRQKKETALASSLRASSFSQSTVEPRRVLLASKLHPPRPSAPQIERAKLFALLETGLSHMLTLLQAPAGFGKTTLVAQWIAKHRAEHMFPSVGWVSLDASDNDPIRFWHYVIAACQAQQQSLGEDALTLLSSPTPSPVTMPALETALTLLLNDLVQQEHPGLLVLDDYQIIVDPAVHETLIFFLDHLPTTFHVLLLSRAEPPFPLLRWRARGDLGELHMADLRFSSEETTTFLRQAVSAPLSDAALTQLDASLEGWAAGLRLLSLTLQGQRSALEIETSLRSLSMHSASTVPPALPGSLLDYFVTEILHAQPEPLQRFLLQTGGLTYLSGPLCDAVTGRKDGAGLLAAMERAGLFLERVGEADPSGPWYRFYTLWAEALRQESSRSLSEEELRALSKRSSYWYEQHAMIAEAIEAALLAHDAPRVALLIDQSTTGGYKWNPPTLLRWLSQLPDKVLAVHPGLCLLFVLLLRFPQEREDATLPEETWERIEAILQMTEEGWREQSGLTWLGGLYAIRALSTLPQDPFTRAVQYAQQALTWLPKETSADERPELRVWRGICLLILGLKDMHEGRFDVAQQVLQEAHACSMATDDRHFTHETILLLGGCSVARGELHQAAEYYRQTQVFAREQEDHKHAASALLGLARLALEWNHLTIAEQQVYKALDLIQHCDQQLSNQAAFQIALLDHARGQTASAQQQLSTLLARLQAIPTPWSLWLSLDVLIWQVRLHLVTVDLQGAQRGLETLARYDQEFSGEQRMKRTILQVRFLLAQGKTNEARYQLEQCLQVAKAQWQMCNALEIQVLLSLTHAALQQKQEAHQWLAQALSQAQSEGFLRLFLEEGEPLARLLVPTFQEKGARSYARTILRAFAQLNGEGTADAARPHDLIIEPLSPQEQRVLPLLIAGRTNPQIAQELIVSVNTVKHHIKQLYRKLGVSNRLEANEAIRNLKPF